MARSELLERARGRVSQIEALQIRAIRATFENPLLDRGIRLLQRHLSTRWIAIATRRLTTLHGVDRLPALDGDRSIVCVTNHRSFFDLYLVTCYLFQSGLKQRILFPVRSNFFYDTAMGFVVNGGMSFFAMYPPIFREPKKAAVNIASLDEISYRLEKGGFFVGIHPEGARKKDDDPYTFLPAQSGAGRIIHRARPIVLPVFINGPSNDIVAQVRSNFDGTGEPVNIVFGAPLEMEDLLDAAPSPGTYKTISERCLEAIAELGQEEKRLRYGAAAP